MKTRDQVLAEQAVDTSCSRRGFLGGGLVGAAALATSGTARAGGGMTLIDQLELFLVERTSFGFTEEDLLEVQARGYRGYLEWQLDHLGVDDTEMDQRLAMYPIVQMDQATVNASFTEYWPMLQQLSSARMDRAIFSKRQLFERMVEFWSDHFSVYAFTSSVGWYKAVDDQVIRQHAMSSFPELLRANTKSPAMLGYLDNDENVVGHANENYAREVLELHTLGVNGGYAEIDVRELARVLTGWTITDTQHEPGQTEGLFTFRPEDHDTGVKNVMGRIYSTGGLADGEDFIDWIALHPNTARFVSRKMIRWLLVYDPPQGLVDQVARVFMNTRGDIKSMIRTILDPRLVASMQPWQDRKLKRPMHFATSFLRAMGKPVKHGEVWKNLKNLGHRPWRWSPPNGYPDSVAAWGANLMPRWDLAVRVISGWINWNWADVDDALLDSLMNGTPRSAWASRLDQLLTGGRMATIDVDTVQAYVNASQDSDVLARREAFMLAISSPSFQYY